MKLLIIAAVILSFGCGWLAGTSYAYSAENPEQDLSQCREIVRDLSLSKDQVRLSDGRWCVL